MKSQFISGPPGSTFEIAPGIEVSETAEVREKLFLQCLKALKIEVEQREIKSIAFPWRIGCGLAGGD